MSEILKLVLEQNEKMYQEVKGYRQENEVLAKEIKDLKEKVLKLEYNSNNTDNGDLRKIKQELSYLANKQRRKDFDWSVGY